MTAPSDLARSPALFPLSIRHADGVVDFVHLSEAEYRAASFLDQRILTPDRRTFGCEWAAVGAEIGASPLHYNFIFHLGHVGSTLLSRLLGEQPQVFSLREPAILRTLAEQRVGVGSAGHADPSDVGTGPQERILWVLSRTWRPEQTALIKATSFVSAIADDLLALAPSARAIFLFATPLAYMRGILGGNNSRREIAAMAASRRRRLDRILSVDLGLAAPSTEGEVIAMSWLCEMISLHRAGLRHPGRGLWLDFDRFLAAPVAGLSLTLTHLDVAHTLDDAQAIVASPLMSQYSKAPEHDYDAALRQQVLAIADQSHSLEIRKGMDWLGGMATRFSLVREVLEASARARR